MFYPLIELCTGVTLVIIGVALFGTSHFLLIQTRYLALLLYYFFLSGAFLIIFFADLKYGIIPFKVVVTALCIILVWHIIFPFLSFSKLEMQLLGLQADNITALFSALGAGSFFLLLFLITKGRGIGFGDVVYVFLMGFTLGFPNVLLGLYIAFVSGAIISLALIASKKKKFKGGTIPFGPFLVLGTFISLLWGNAIIAYILHMLGV